MINIIEDRRLCKPITYKSKYRYNKRGPTRWKCLHCKAIIRKKSVNPARCPKGRLVNALPEVVDHVKACFGLQSSPVDASAQADAHDDCYSAGEAETPARMQVDNQAEFEPKALEIASSSSVSTLAPETAVNRDESERFVIARPPESEPEGSSAIALSMPQFDEMKPDLSAFMV